jgi:hypothetical protein
MNIKLSVINHKNKKEEGKKERGPPARRSRCQIPEQFYLSHKEILDTNKGYKYPTIYYPLGMSDSREDQERREISRVSPCDYTFSDKWDPSGSPL